MIGGPLSHPRGLGAHSAKPPRTVSINYQVTKLPGDPIFTRVSGLTEKYIRPNSFVISWLIHGFVNMSKIILHSSIESRQRAW